MLQFSAVRAHCLCVVLYSVSSVTVDLVHLKESVVLLTLLSDTSLQVLFLTDADSGTSVKCYYAELNSFRARSEVESHS